MATHELEALYPSKEVGDKVKNALQYALHVGDFSEFEVAGFALGIFNDLHKKASAPAFMVDHLNKGIQNDDQVSEFLELLGLGDDGFREIIASQAAANKAKKEKTLLALLITALKAQRRPKMVKN